MRRTETQQLLRAQALVLGVSCLMGMPAWAQSEAPAETDAPQVEETTTSTTAFDEDLERPETGPGSAISQAEHEPARPPTAAEVDAGDEYEAKLALFEKAMSYYADGAQTFSDDMRDLIRLKYEDQKALLSAQYDRAIEELEKEERARRLEAIARFEEFLRKYPNDPTYTPDAMFRLAELYFEKSSDEYLLASKSYEKELVAWENGKRETEPPAPEPSYEKTIGLHRDLLARFPDYRLADHARYLLGYCYSEQLQMEEALAAYLDLTSQHPDSKLLAEVWTRIGEIYFDGNDEDSLQKAIAAYDKVRAYPDSPYYDKALYKIAWTYYRLDRFDEAVDSFIALVNYADQQKKATGVSGSELRAEAIQYIAISLADEEWGGLDRAKQVLAPLENRDFTGELWKRYGEVLFDQTRYALAIDVLRYTIGKYPNAPYNPEAQEKIVRAHEQLRDFESATAAREELVKDYSEGSKWYVANQDDTTAINKAESLTERSLYTAAIFRHQQAQAHKAANRLASARDSYVAAASAYETYLGRFPDSKNSYDFEFFLAECLYYSADYDRAAIQYDKVRDSKLDNKHLEAAALSSVITYEKVVEEAIKSGKIPDPALLTATERKGQAIEPKPIDATRQKLIESSDRYTTMLPRSERAPAIRYRAAEIFYKHDQFEEARKRFEGIVADYPSNEVARYASNLIIESYLAAEDYEKVEQWSQRLIEIAQANTKADGETKADFIDNLKGFKVGAQFKQAERYDAEGKFEQAADTYVRLVDDNPTHEFADKALFNAAVAYEKVKRFDSASQIYRRIYEKYPRSDLAPRALFRTGINAEKGFDFPAAVTAYTQLVERYPKSEDRADALYNVAVVLENQQEYGKAAAAYKRYAQTFPSREDAGQIFFRSALVYEKMKAWPDMITTLQDFIKRYTRTSAQKERIIEAHMKIGDAEAKRERNKSALAAYKSCVSEFSRRGLAITGRAGGFAARCQFEIAEDEFRKYDAIKIVGTGKAQVKALTDKAKAQRVVEGLYSDVFKYKRAEQTLAASYRIGHSYERFAESLFTAPIPKEFEKDEELAMEYKMQLEDRAAVLERKAEAAYRKAYEEAKKTRVTNEWTQRILEGLNKYAPQEFPVQKRGKALMQESDISGNGLDDLGTATPPSTAPDASTTSPGGARTAEAGEGR